MAYNATVSDGSSAESSETATGDKSNDRNLEGASKVLCGLGRSRLSAGKQHEDPSSRNSEAKYSMYIGHVVLLSELINIFGRPVVFE
ncbi:hypothetical protein ACTXT7_017078 [Hymenolepis weldensis]